MASGIDLGATEVTLVGLDLKFERSMSLSVAVVVMASDPGYVRSIEHKPWGGREGTMPVPNVLEVANVLKPHEGDLKS